jgi:hypothetical protein
MKAITTRGGKPRGQTIVVFALAVTGLMAMIGLIIDGGNAFAQQRRTQNGTDAAAEAGAVELARRLVGLPGSEGQWDARVLNAVNLTATANGLTNVPVPVYTNRLGAPLGPVGTGSIPANTQGVQASGDRTFSTFVSGLIGLGSFKASATATAVTGYVETTSAGALLPLTFPILTTTCQNGGGPAKLFHPFGNAPDGEWPYGPNNRVAMPLCSNGPGNVGWIDWSPPGGGASELREAIERPNGPPVTTPKWYEIAQTGAVTSADSAMDTWEGEDVLFPIFYVEADDPDTLTFDESVIGTCDTEPGGDKTQLSDCPPGNEGGNGSNQWYYLVTFGSFHLENSFIQGNHDSECNASSLASKAGNNVNNCLIGYFNGPVVASEGTVGGTTSGSSLTPLAIQLIK